MIVKNIEGAEIYKLLNNIDSWFNRKVGRFTISLCVDHSKYKAGCINIYKVRLRTAKEFCGNHPAACEIGNPTHRKGDYATKQRGQPSNYRKFPKPIALSERAEKRFFNS
jgi:hypothetical protein